MDNYTFLIEWEDTSKVKHVIGALIKDCANYYFKYASDEQLQEAKKKGFKCVPTFLDEDKIYVSKKLFDFFTLRIDKNSDKPEDLLFEENNGRIFTDHFLMKRV